MSICRALDPGNTNLAELAELWLQVKSTENAYRNQRVELERRILALTGHKVEGSDTKEDNGYKITTIGRLTRKVDWQKYAEIVSQIPEDMRPIQNKKVLDLERLRYLERNEPAVYAIFSQCITVTPAKTGVVIKRPEAS